MTEQTHPVYAEITGPIVMIGFGSIGRGTLPLIERHFKFDKSRMVVIDPRDEPADMEILKKYGVLHIKEYVTKDNYKDLLKPLLTKGGGQGFCVNLSVDTGSLDIMKLCRKLDVLYIDTVVEPWLGFYFDKNMKNADRTNYALRETVRKEKAKNPGGATAVSTCGANPGMVSWFVKQALVNLANEIGVKFDEPDQHDREGWAKLMKKVGVKGIHIAERDTQRTKHPKPLNVFWNTWSVEGFISEGMQPAELGWGTHENWMPKNAKKQKKGCKAAIYLEQPGANTRVRTWCRRLVRNTVSLSLTTSRFRSPIISRSATRMAKSRSARPATMPTIRPTMRSCRCMRCSVTAARRSRSTTFSTKTNWRTASTNSVCSSTATRRTPTGSARACRSKKPAASRPIRMRPACR